MMNSILAAIRLVTDLAPVMSLLVAFAGIFTFCVMEHRSGIAVGS